MRLTFPRESDTDARLVVTTANNANGSYNQFLNGLLVASGKQGLLEINRGGATGNARGVTFAAGLYMGDGAGFNGIISGAGNHAATVNFSGSSHIVGNATFALQTGLTVNLSTLSTNPPNDSSVTVSGGRLLLATIHWALSVESWALSV